MIHPIKILHILADRKTIQMKGLFRTYNQQQNQQQNQVNNNNQAQQGMYITDQTEKE